MSLNNLPGNRHDLMNKCENDSAAEGIRQETGARVFSIIERYKVIFDINSLFLGDYKVDPHFHESKFGTIFDSEGSGLDPHPLEEKILSLQELYESSQYINPDVFKTFLNPDGMSLIDEFCYQYEKNLGNGLGNVDSNATGFAVYLVMGLEKEFENIFCENMTFDVSKIQSMLALLCENFLEQPNNKTKEIQLHRIIILCNLLNAICFHSQLDVEKKDQINQINVLIGDLIIFLIVQIRDSKNKNIQKMLSNMIYIYHRNIVVHSYTKFISTKASDNMQTIRDFSKVIVDTIRSANQIVTHQPSMIPVSIGNISYLIGVLCSKLKNVELVQSEKNELQQLINDFHNFIYGVLSYHKGYKKITASFFKQNTIPDLFNQINQLFQIVFYLFKSSHQNDDELMDALLSDTIFLKELLTKNELSIIDGETIHHIIMFSDNISIEFLNDVFYKLLEKTYSNSDAQTLGFKNIDVILKRLKEKGALNYIHLLAVEEMLKSKGGKSGLLVPYSRLYFSLAYFYLGEKDFEKTKKYLFKFSKIRDTNKGFGIYLTKFGFDEAFFYENMLLGAETEEIQIDNQSQDDIILSYIHSYTNEYFYDLFEIFMMNIDILKQSNQYNINIIYDFIKHHVFYGICDIVHKKKETYAKKGERIFDLKDHDGNIILTFTYRDQYEVMFKKLLKNASKTLSRMIKMAQSSLQLDEKEQELLTELTDAKESNRLVGFYQPITDAQGNIVYYEMLMRILEENKVDVKHQDPVPFLEVGRKKGLIPEITFLLIHQVKSFMVESDEGYKNLKVSINMDANDLLDEKFFTKLKKAFHNTGLNQHISFEILESAWHLHKKDEIYMRLKELTLEPYNIEFALDDFGTGEASIVKLMELLEKGIIKKIKIDGELIQNLSLDKSMIHKTNKFRRTLSILKGIFDAAKHDNVKIVCEYIRDVDCLDKMNLLFPDVDLLYQGWGAGGKDALKPATQSEYKKRKKL